MALIARNPLPAAPSPNFTPSVFIASQSDSGNSAANKDAAASGAEAVHKKEKEAEMEKESFRYAQNTVTLQQGSISSGESSGISGICRSSSNSSCSTDDMSQTSRKYECISSQAVKSREEPRASSLKASAAPAAHTRCGPPHLSPAGATAAAATEAETALESAALLGLHFDACIVAEQQKPDGQQSNSSSKPAFLSADSSAGVVSSSSVADAAVAVDEAGVYTAGGVESGVFPGRETGDKRPVAGAAAVSVACVAPPPSEKLCRQEEAERSSVLELLPDVYRKQLLKCTWSATSHTTKEAPAPNEKKDRGAAAEAASVFAASAQTGAALLRHSQQQQEYAAKNTRKSTAKYGSSHEGTDADWSEEAAAAMHAMEEAAAAAALEGRREDEAALREQLQQRREQQQWQRQRLQQQQHDEVLQWELDEVLRSGFGIKNILSRVEQLEVFAKQVEQEIILCTQGRRNELLSSTATIRELGQEVAALQDQVVETRELLGCFQQQLLVPSLRVVEQQQQLQHEQQQQLLLQRMQQVQGVRLALFECQSRGFLPLAAALLMKAFTLPLVATAGKVVASSTSVPSCLNSLKNPLSTRNSGTLSPDRNTYRSYNETSESREKSYFNYKSSSGNISRKSCCQSTGSTDSAFSSFRNRSSGHNSADCKSAENRTAFLSCSRFPDSLEKSQRQPFFCGLKQSSESGVASRFGACAAAALAAKVGNEEDSEADRETDGSVPVLLCMRQAREEFLLALSHLRADITDALCVAANSLPPPPAATATALADAAVSDAHTNSDDTCNNNNGTTQHMRAWQRYLAALIAAALLPPAACIGSLLVSQLAAAATATTQIFYAFLPAAAFAAASAPALTEAAAAAAVSILAEEEPSCLPTNNCSNIHSSSATRKYHNFLHNNSGICSNSKDSRTTNSSDSHSRSRMLEAAAAADPQTRALEGLAAAVSPEDAVACFMKILEVHMQLLLGMEQLLRWHEQLAELLLLQQQQQLRKTEEATLQEAPSKTSSNDLPFFLFSSTTEERKACRGSGHPETRPPPSTNTTTTIITAKTTSTTTFLANTNSPIPTPPSIPSIPSPAGSSRSRRTTDSRSTYDIAAHIAAQVREEVPAMQLLIVMLLQVRQELQQQRRLFWEQLQQQAATLLRELRLVDAHFCCAQTDLISLIHAVYVYILTGSRFCCLAYQPREQHVLSLLRQATAAAPLQAAVLCSAAAAPPPSSQPIEVKTEGQGVRGFGQVEGPSSELSSQAAGDQAEAHQQTSAAIQAPNKTTGTSNNFLKEEEKKGFLPLLPSRNVVLLQLHEKLLVVLKQGMQREQIQALLNLLSEENWKRLPVPRSFRFFHSPLPQPPPLPLEVYVHPMASLFLTTTASSPQNAVVVSNANFCEEKEEEEGEKLAACDGQQQRESAKTEKEELLLPPFFFQQSISALPPFPYSRMQQRAAASTKITSSRSSEDNQYSHHQLHHQQNALKRSGSRSSVKGRNSAGEAVMMTHNSNSTLSSGSHTVGGGDETSLLPQENLFRFWQAGSRFCVVPGAFYEYDRNVVVATGSEAALEKFSSSEEAAAAAWFLDSSATTSSSFTRSRDDSPVVSVTAKLAAKSCSVFWQLAASSPLLTSHAVAAVLELTGFYVTAAAAAALPKAQFAALLLSPPLSRSDPFLSASSTTMTPEATKNTTPTITHPNSTQNSSPKKTVVVGRESSSIRQSSSFVEAADAVLLQRRAPKLRELLLQQEQLLQQWCFPSAKMSQQQNQSSYPFWLHACSTDSNTDQQRLLSENLRIKTAPRPPPQLLLLLLKPMTAQTSPGSLWGAAERVTAVESAAELVKHLHQQLHQSPPQPAPPLFTQPANVLNNHHLSSSSSSSHNNQSSCSSICRNTRSSEKELLLLPWLAERLTSEQHKFLERELNKLTTAVEELRKVAYFSLAADLCDSLSFVCAVLRAVTDNSAAHSSAAPAAVAVKEQQHSQQQQQQQFAATTMQVESTQLLEQQHREGNRKKGGFTNKGGSGSSRGSSGCKTLLGLSSGALRRARTNAKPGEVQNQHQQQQVYFTDALQQVVEAQQKQLQDVYRKLRYAGGGSIPARVQLLLWKAIFSRQLFDAIELLSAVPLPAVAALQGLAPDALLAFAHQLRQLLRKIAVFVLAAAAAAASPSIQSQSPQQVPAGAAAFFTTHQKQQSLQAQEEEEEEEEQRLEQVVGLWGESMKDLDAFTEAVGMTATEVLHWARSQQQRLLLSTVAAPAPSSSPCLQHCEQQSQSKHKQKSNLDLKHLSFLQQREHHQQVEYSLRVLTNVLYRLEFVQLLPRGRALSLERRFYEMHDKILHQHEQPQQLQHLKQ